MRGPGRAGLVSLIALVALSMLVGCEAKTQHNILDFFFDGVPPQEALQPSQEAPQSTPTSVPNAPPPRVVPQPVTPQPVVFAHRPFQEKKCGACHELTQGNRVDKTSALCFRCHQEDLVLRQVIHAPVAGGDCLICHDPHQSATPYLLLSAQPTLCFKCHRQPDLPATPPHTPESQQTCTDCHNPHTSDFHDLLIAPDGSKAAFLAKPVPLLLPRPGR